VDHSCGRFEIYDSRMDVVRRVLLGKKCVCDIGMRGGNYGSRMYSYHCNGKWLMDFHGSLLIFFVLSKI
jgi:hypothetical protein